MPVSTLQPEESMKSSRQPQHQKSQLAPQQMVHWFVASSYASGSFSEERVKNSISLLHRVPAARSAVLQRFAMLFDEAVRTHLDHMEFQSSATGISAEVAGSLELVVRTLLELLESNGKAWAPILCQWSVEALGQMSSCNKQRQVVPQPSNLARLLSFWLNIVPMRMMLDIYRTCLKILIAESPQSCVGSLLSASTNHSPYFDWVVADVGSAFPDAIIERVLNTGFSKFCKLRWTLISHKPSASITMQENEQTILTIVSRILEHLSSVHNTNICDKIFDMFKSPPPGPTCCKVKVTLYLMNLFSVSNVVLRATTSRFVQQINAEMLNSLYKEFQKLYKGKSELESISALVVHLVCQSTFASNKLVLLLLNASCSKPQGRLQGLDKPLRNIFAKIFSLLLNDLKHLALKGGYEKENIFEGLVKNYKMFCDDMLKSNSTTRKAYLYELILAMCFYKTSSSLIMSHFLLEAVTTADLTVFLRLHSDLSPIVPELLECIIENSFSVVRKLPSDKVHHFLRNILYLITEENQQYSSSTFRTRLTKQLVDVFDDLVLSVCKLRYTAECSHAAVDILYQLTTTVSASQLGLGARLLPLTQALVYYFYKLLHAGRVNNDKEMRSCQRLIVQLTQTPEIYAVVCRGLLEGAFGSERNSVLFGKKTEAGIGDDEEVASLTGSRNNGPLSLLAMHHKASSNVTSGLRNAFVPISFEAGLIGSGPKRKKKCPVSNATQASNNECLSLLIYRCSCKTGGRIDTGCFPIPDTPHTFDSNKLEKLADALLLSSAVVSPQLATALTLGGDVAWPSCNMKKMTIERDLKLFHFLDEHPFVWQLLSLAAHNPHAFHRLSPLIRSCVAVLLSHCESSRHQEALHESSTHYKVAVKVIGLLGKGRLLPEPMSFIGEFFHLITPYQVSVLLTTVWNFIKEHPPEVEPSGEHVSVESSLDGVNLQPYLAVIQQVIHANVAQLGHLFAKFTITK